MGMLLYMMETQNKNNKAEGATKEKEVAPKPVSKEPEVVEVEQEQPKKATRAEIMKMTVAAVRAYAEEQGIEGANAISGAELKRMLVNKMFEDEE